VQLSGFLRLTRTPRVIGRKVPPMDITKIPAGQAPPFDINVFVEIPQGGLPVKYELDKSTGVLFVNRFLHTTMFYPGNYGFIPQTLSDDGDPLDVIIVSQAAVFPGAVVRCRPIGILLMEDEAGADEKVIAVPVDQLNPYFSGVRSYEDLPAILRDQIAHFFRHYKDLEQGKWVKVTRWAGPDEAAQAIQAAIDRAKQSSGANCS
jgi:inorganic pyrophosphatase